MNALQSEIPMVALASEPIPMPLRRDAIAKPVVLLVDDELEIRVVLEFGLRKHFDVETAASADEAELLLATRRYDAIVCDHLMPGEEGVAFLTRVQEQFPKVRRILMTGYTNETLIARSTPVAGLSACLLKPLTPATVIEAIQQALAQ